MAAATFCTLEGHTFSMSIEDDMTVEEVVSQLRRGNAPNAAFLLCDGAVLPPSSLFDAGAVDVVVGETVELPAPEDSLCVSRPFKGELARRLAATGENVIVLGGAELNELNCFVRWFLKEDIVRILEEIIEENELTSGNPDSGIEELLHKRLPISDEKLRQLCDMGFPADAARRALWLNNMNIQQSIDFIFDKCPEPLTLEDYRKVKHASLKRQSEERLRTELIARATIQDFDADITFEPSCQLGNTSDLSAAIEDAFSAAPVEAATLRLAFEQLTIDPQLIFEYLDDPVLAPFFRALRASAAAFTKPYSPRATSNPTIF
ncbi:hypothetical protein DIPPA_09328 [Diplonema papillatum]|nr:hypothetical protein DIPPA_09328 [Diplonema papillatum]